MGIMIFTVLIMKSFNELIGSIVNKLNEINSPDFFECKTKIKMEIPIKAVERGHVIIAIKKNVR